MRVIPLQAVPSQQVQVTLGGQQCVINVYQKRFGLFLDLTVNGNPVVIGAICQYFNRIIRSVYLGFIGDLMFIDNQGANDPDYTGLGDTTSASNTGALTSRYDLVYLETADLVAIGVPHH